MIPSTDVQNELLTAELKTANLTYMNLLALQGGALQVSWKTVKYGQRAINAVSRQLALGDTASPNFLKAWQCLSSFVGNYAGGPISPDAQNPGIIIITNPADTPQPTVIGFDDMASGSSGTIYNNPTWAGWNPVMFFTVPASTFLQLGVDYVILPGGGFQLLNTSSVCPQLFPGNFIVVTSYEQIP